MGRREEKKSRGKLGRLGKKKNSKSTYYWE
jgi:hypothetical protein